MTEQEKQKLKPLPCKELHCELLRRINTGVHPIEFTLSIEEMAEQAEQLTEWFLSQKIKPQDVLGIMEITKAGIWEYIVRNN